MEGLILIFVIIFIFWLFAAGKNKNSELEKAIKDYNFSADYKTRNKTLLLDSKTKNLLVYTRKKTYKLIVPEMLMQWRGTSEYSNARKGSYYYLELVIKDIDEPTVKIFFGAMLSERDDWFNRLTAVYNG